MNRSIVPENNKILSSTPLYFTRLNINLEGGKRGGLHSSTMRAVHPRFQERYYREIGSYGARK